MTEFLLCVCVCVYIYIYYSHAEIATCALLHIGNVLEYVIHDEIRNT